MCPKIEDYDALTNLPNLESLRIVDCKGVPSIKFINNFPALKILSLLGNTDVLDGDMKPAKDIKEVFYNDRKHYNIKIENMENEAQSKRNIDKIKRLFK
jgi:hypothetical protein